MEAELRELLRPHGGPCVAGIGTFDGVHAGHRRVIGAARERAREAGLRAVAVTFSPRPDVALRPDEALPDLCSLEERVERLVRAGAGDVVVIPFTAELAEMSAVVFVDLLRDELGVRELCVGEDFALGRNRAADVPALRELGLTVICPPLVLAEDGGKLSSSTLRRRAAVAGVGAR
ncbi:MAG: hypothetical protein BGO11_02235 [Solirubrobacterales bacterium 70-9]|nr:MAG: hypothetical protein BGO11_02235 [Solirubrobacterales bacterium 70-9]